MTLGRIVEVTFTLIRRHARVLIPLYAVVDLPLYVLTTIASDAFVADLTRAVGPGGLAEPAAISAEEAAILLPGFLQVMATTLLLGVVSAIGAGAIAIAVREALEDRPPRFLAALGGAVRRSVALIGSSLIALAATVALLAVGFGMLVLLGIASGGPALTPGGGVTTFLALIVAIAIAVGIVALQVRWTFQFAAATLDGQGAVSTLRRSWRVTRGSAWRVFGVTLLFVFMTFVLGSLVVELGAAIAAGPVSGDAAVAGGISLVAGAIASSVIGVVVPVALTVMYLDLRSRSADPA